MPYPGRVRFALAIALTVLVACGPSAPAVKVVKPDPTKEASYGEAVQRLNALNLELETSIRKRKAKDAAPIIEKAQPLSNLLLAAPRPTLVAMEAVSDFDDLYGRVLLATKQYGFARFQFQRNVARWKYWQPRNEESDRRLKAAEAAIAECDRLMTR